jgi:two-component system, NtrC family, nitrogen regulation sensor histidine kinase NtrY
LKLPGRIQARLALAILVTALIPVLVAVWLGERYVRETGARYFVPEIGAHLDRSLSLYDEAAHTLKARMRAEGAAIALEPKLRRAVKTGDAEAVTAELKVQLSLHPSLVSLRAVLPDGKALASVDRGRPLDTERENQLEVSRPLTEAAEGDDAPELQLVFAADKARFETERAGLAQFITTYRIVDQRSKDDVKGYVRAFTALLGITILAAVAVGTLLARSVAVRLRELAKATERVGAGNLSIRVSEAGSDEITALSRAFNRMLGEVEASRARIEYLQRISAWQEMARRLAHEIKNPLTPIQLGVQEIHRRYEGKDEQFRTLLDTTLEIVEDEVGTLRRLVSEFSDFARLPQARLERADLAEFLAEQRRQIERTEPDEASGEELSVIRSTGTRPSFEFRLPAEPAYVAIDRQMLRRVLLNMIQNAADALGDAGSKSPKIRVGLTRDRNFYVLEVDDNGPGIPDELREVIFDPYFTTKHSGTGLGLAIVKKIAIEHGGMVTAGRGALGGARLRLTLPVFGTAARELPLLAERPSSAAS